MAGGEDAVPHSGPSTTNGTIASPTPTPYQDASKTTIQKTGEAMLGFALAIIFIVIACVITHLLLKERRKKAARNGTSKNKKKTGAKKKKKDLESGGVELHSVDKKVFEAAGVEVVLCELPEDAPPRQELDAGDDAFPFSPLERGYTGTTTSSIQFSPDAISPEDPWPEGRQLAAYWAMR
jgi:hypothetical protein